MKYIYQGPLRKLNIKNFEIKDGNVKILEYEKPIIRKDMLFYKGFANAFISFEYATRLLDEAEALDILYTELSARNNPNEGPYPSCIFSNPNEITYKEQVTNQEFKQLKKTLKKGSN
jgi:hypothetical protein